MNKNREIIFAKEILVKAKKLMKISKMKDSEEKILMYEHSLNGIKTLYDIYKDKLDIDT